MTPDQIEKERAKFEARFVGVDLAKFESNSWHGPAGTYKDDYAQDLFDGWLARAEQDQALRASVLDLIKYWDSAKWKWHIHLGEFIDKMRDLL